MIAPLAYLGRWQAARRTAAPEVRAARRLGLAIGSASRMLAATSGIFAVAPFGAAVAAVRDQEARDRLDVVHAEARGLGPGSTSLKSTAARGELARAALRYGVTIDEVDGFLVELEGIRARHRMVLFGEDVAALLDLRFNPPAVDLRAALEALEGHR